MSNESARSTRKFLFFNNRDLTARGLLTAETLYKEKFIMGDAILDNNSIMIYPHIKKTFTGIEDRFVYISIDDLKRYKYTVDELFSLITFLLKNSVAVEVTFPKGYFDERKFNRTDRRWKSVYITVSYSETNKDGSLNMVFAMNPVVAANMTAARFEANTRLFSHRRMFVSRFEETCAILIKNSEGEPTKRNFYHNLVRNYKHAVRTFIWGLTPDQTLKIPCLDIKEKCPDLLLVTGALSICEEILDTAKHFEPCGWKSIKFNKPCYVAFEQNGIIINEDDLYRDHDRRLLGEHEYWCKRTIFDFCVWFPELPPYVCLEILDWLGEVTHYPHQKKIEYIFGIQKSTRKILDARENNKTIKTE